MGGINHQPCNRYLPNSTRLSRSVSVARTALESANIELEDVLLNEMESNCKQSLSGVVKKIRDHGTSLEDILICVARLKDQMHAENYKDLSALSWVGENIISSLAERGMGRIEELSEVYTIMSNKSFYGVLDRFSQSINKLISINASLAAKLVETSNSRTMVSVLVESNHHLNFRPIFAELYSEWTKFISLFSCSSVLSTEIWYSEMGYGSLLDESSQTNRTDIKLVTV